MAAIAANLINRMDKDYPQIPYGIWSKIPVEIQWGANAAADTATVVLPGKVKGVCSGAFGVAIVQSAQYATVTLTAKVASLGTQIHEFVMEVGR